MRGTTVAATTVAPGPGSAARGLLAAAHPAPGLAVTLVATLLAVAADRPAGTVVLVAAAVGTGQLTVGWVNDLVDLPRDRAVARTDKPLVGGRVTPRTVAVATAATGVACVLLSAALGWRAGGVHLICLGLAHAYNLVLKTTAWSWLPYAGAFGLLPAVAALAGPDPATPAWWALVAGAALGVGAHLVNALPDLADDEATGVRGLPHRLGARRARPLAALLLAAASVLAALGPAGAPSAGAVVLLAGVGSLTVVALVGRGPAPFRAAMVIALLDVVLLVTSR